MRQGAVGVVIGTTEGPSEVLRIAVEAPEIRSVVCLGMSTEALPISPAYDAFVRRPTGVVERELGHPSYRADVSARIDNGNSWQLGLYLAHRLMADGRLGSPKDPPEQWIWVTGTLDTDLVIGPVAEVERKLERSKAWFAGHLAEGRAVAVMVPEQSAGEVADPPVGATVLAAAGIEPSLAYLGLEMPEVVKARAADPARAVPAPSASRSWAGGLLVLALVLMGSGVAAWLVDPALFDRAAAMVSGAGVEPEPAVAGVPGPAPELQSPPPAPSLEQTVVPRVQINPPKEITAPAPVRDTIPAVEITWTQGRPSGGTRCGGELAFSAFEPSRQEKSGPVCQMAMTISNRSTARASVDAAAGILGRLREYMRQSRHVARERAVLEPGGTMRITLDIPGWVRGEIQVRAVVLVRDATAKASAQTSETPALEVITAPPSGPGVRVSTITLN